MKNFIKLKAQLTVEYLMLFTVVIVAVVFVAIGKKSPFQSAYVDALKERAVSMDMSTHELTGTNATEDSYFICGNDVVEIGEQCDQNDFDGETCATLGFSGGSLSCTAVCKFNTSFCVS